MIAILMSTMLLVQFIKVKIQTIMNIKDCIMNTELQLLGKRIAYLRKKRKLTQEKLAELANCSTNHISKLESARTNPSFELLANLAHSLNVEFKELFYFDENKSIEFVRNELEKIIKKSDDNKIQLLYRIFKSIDY